MKRINWEKYKFHCSSLPRLMVNPRSKSEILSETAKSFLQEVYIEEVYGRKKTDTVNKYTEKGLLVEQDSLDLATRVLKQGFLAKNKETLENDYLIGTPDLVKPKTWDIKSCWNLWTFFDVDEEKAFKDYYWQLMGYMWLTKASEADLIYCLVNTPDHLMRDELYKMSFHIPEETVDNYKNNFIFDDIPENKRVKRYSFQYSDLSEVNLISRILVARDYLKGLSL